MAGIHRLCSVGGNTSAHRPGGTGFESRSGQDVWRSFRSNVDIICFITLYKVQQLYDPRFGVSAHQYRAILSILSAYSIEAGNAPNGMKDRCSC